LISKKRGPDPRQLQAGFNPPQVFLANVWRKAMYLQILESPGWFVIVQNLEYCHAPVVGNPPRGSLKLPWLECATEISFQSRYPEGILIPKIGSASSSERPEAWAMYTTTPVSATNCNQQVSEPFHAMCSFPKCLFGASIYSDPRHHQYFHVPSPIPGCEHSD
jgi:hypothetical protein